MQRLFQGFHHPFLPSDDIKKATGYNILKIWAPNIYEAQKLADRYMKRRIGPNYSPVEVHPIDGVWQENGPMVLDNGGKVRMGENTAMKHITIPKDYEK